MSKDRDFDKRKKFMMELLGDPVYQPMRFREIAGLLRLSKDEKKDLYRVLDDLVAEGKADLDSKGRYSKVTGRKRGKEKLHRRKEEKSEKRLDKYKEEASGRKSKKNSGDRKEKYGSRNEHGRDGRGRYEDRRSGRRYKEDDPEIRLARL